VDFTAYTRWLETSVVLFLGLYSNLRTGVYMKAVGAIALGSCRPPTQKIIHISYNLIFLGVLVFTLVNAHYVYV
jgi:hypothetical protein